MKFGKALVIEQNPEYAEVIAQYLESLPYIAFCTIIDDYSRGKDQLVSYDINGCFPRIVVVNTNSGSRDRLHSFLEFYHKKFFESYPDVAVITISSSLDRAPQFEFYFGNLSQPSDIKGLKAAVARTPMAFEKVKPTILSLETAGNRDFLQEVSRSAEKVDVVVAKSNEAYFDALTYRKIDIVILCQTQYTEEHLEKVKEINSSILVLVLYEDSLNAVEKYGYSVFLFLKISELAQVMGAISATVNHVNLKQKNELLLKEQSLMNKALSIVNKELTRHNELLEEKVDERTEALLNSNKVKDKLFSVISHDLRSPLASLRALLDLMLNNHNALTRDEFVTYGAKISQSLNNVSVLLDDLLQWSLSQMNHLDVKPAYQNVVPIVQSTYELCEGIAIEKGVHLDLSVKQDEVIAYCDSSITSFIIRNLLQNAIKFTEPEGRIFLSIEKENGGVRLSVKDSGVGIEERFIKDLFDLNNVHSTKGTLGEKGTGLGLPLSKEYALKQGGDLEVFSILGKGSRFSLILQGENE